MWQVTTFPGEAAWLEARRRYVTSSDVPAILGVSPYEDHSAFAVWLRKVRGEETAWAKSMRRRLDAGRRMEELHRQWFTEETGLHPFRPAEGYYLVTNEAIPWLAVTPDWLVIEPGADGEMIEGVVEGKTDTNRDGRGYVGSGPHRYAVTQLHAAMLCLEMGRGWVATSFGQGLDFGVYPLAADQRLLDLIRDRGEVFHRYLASGDPPDASFIDGSDATRRAIAEIHPDLDESAVELDPTVYRQLVQRRREIPGEISKLEAEKNMLTSSLMLAMGGATYARVPGAFEDGRVVKAAWEEQPEKIIPAGRSRVLRFVNDPAKKGKKR